MFSFLWGFILFIFLFNWWVIVIFVVVVGVFVFVVSLFCWVFLLIKTPAFLLSQQSQRMARFCLVVVVVFVVVVLIVVFVVVVGGGGGGFLLFFIRNNSSWQISKYSKIHEVPPGHSETSLKAFQHRYCYGILCIVKL